MTPFPRWLYLIGAVLAAVAIFLCLGNIHELIPEGANPTDTYPGQPFWLLVAAIAGISGLYFWARWENTQC